MAFLGLILLLAAVITLCGRHEDRSADCAVVCGHRLTRDGDRSATLQARTRRAVELLESGRVKGLIFTGGRERGTPWGGVHERVAEGWAAAELALEMGAPERAVVLETSSRTTWENFLRARNLMREQGWHSCLVVTDPYHLLRCRLIARQLGLTAGSAPVPGAPSSRWPWSVYYTLGECGSMLLYLGGRIAGWYRDTHSR